MFSEAYPGMLKLGFALPAVSRAAFERYWTLAEHFVKQDTKPRKQVRPLLSEEKNLGVKVEWLVSTLLTH